MEAKILTIGTFDIPHVGHAHLFQQIKRLFPNSYLVVGINSDEFVEQFKAKRPLFSFKQREALILNLDEVDMTTKNDSAGRELIARIKPNILVIGSDWATKNYHKQIDTPQDWLDDHDITLVYVPYTKGISTSYIKSLC